MRARAVLVVAMSALAFAPGAGRAASTGVLAGPGSAQTNWTTPAAVAEPGERPLLVNLDVSFHGLESEDAGPDTQPWCGPLDPSKPEGPANPRRYPVGACPLLWADTALPLGRAPSEILGLENAVPGRGYPFGCPIFGEMRGTLIIVG